MASKYIQKFPIPNDFPNILHDLAKEILRYQPDDIIEFSALYFKCLQEGKELDYPKKGSNIPCDFKNVTPGVKSDKVRSKPEDKSNLMEAVNKASNLSNTNPNNHNNEKPKGVENIGKSEKIEAKPIVVDAAHVVEKEEDGQLSVNSKKAREISKNFTTDLLDKMF